MTELQHRRAQPAPVTPAELQDLLDLVVAYTGREPDRTMVQIWGAQAQLGRWTYAEAARALHRWGGDHEPGAWLEPATVTRAIRAERQDAAMRAELEALKARPVNPDGHARVAAIVAGLAEGKTIPEDEPSGRRAAYLDVACPHCRAGIGSHCTGPRRQPLRLTPCHPSRLDAIAEHQERPESA